MNSNNNNNNMYLFKSLNIPKFNDLPTFCDEIGISTKLIFLILNDSKKFYDTFDLKKKNGGIRAIKSPKFSLKLIQKWILKNILEKIKVSDESMAFRVDKLGGIKINAEKHKYSLYILEMDMENFFNSITERQVFLIFKSIGYNNDAAKILTKICTYDGYLPQGGVCSPYLSNLVCLKLDKRITGLCSNRDIIYSRYADDLTFSCDNKENLKRCKKVIEDITCNEGYSMNISKTRYLSPRSHKRVTGVTITHDNKLKAKKETKKKVRAMIHKAIVTKNYCETMGIKGYISYINSIEDGYRQKIIEYINKLIKRDYRCFKGIVDEYNKNKNSLIKGLDDMIYKALMDEVQEEVAYALEETGNYISADAFLEYSYLNRYNYLLKSNLEEDELEYIELAKIIKDQSRPSENKEYNSEFPF